MGKVTETWLENKIKELNDWIDNHHDQHHLMAQKKQQRDQYAWKLSEMDEYDLKTIEI